MPLRSLHPNIQRIVEAIKAAVGALGATDHLTIVGGLAKFLNGKDYSAGDVDVVIDAPLCEKFWDFYKILHDGGIKSVWDLFDRPSVDWEPCRQDYGHALSLTIDCAANVLSTLPVLPPISMKHANLDIKIRGSDLGKIPNSDRWVSLIPFGELRALVPVVRDARVKKDHADFIRSLNNDFKAVPSRSLHKTLQLYYEV